MKKRVGVSALALAVCLAVGAVHLARGNPLPPQSEGLKVVNTELPDGKTGVEYYCVITGSGGRKPYDYAATGLPPGLTMGAERYAHDTIIGKPAQTGTFSPVITITDSSRPTPLTASVTLTLKVVAP